MKLFPNLSKVIPKNNFPKRGVSVDKDDNCHGCIISIKRMFYKRRPPCLKERNLPLQSYMSCYLITVESLQIINVNNYMSISKLFFLSSILEGLVYDQLKEYLYSNNILSMFQSGFRKNYSTIQQPWRWWTTFLLHLIESNIAHLFWLICQKLLTGSTMTSLNRGFLA